MVDNSAGFATKFTGGAVSPGNTLYQLEGSLNGTPGRFEWIVNARGQVTHRMFVPEGTLNGISIKP